MATWKTTMLMALTTNATGASMGNHTGGWSESFYIIADSFAQVASDFLALCAARAPLLPKSARIVGQRYQQLDPVGGSSTGGNQYPGNTAYVTDVPQLSLLCRAGSGSFPNFRLLELRGLPDALVVEGEYKPDTMYPGLVQDFANVCNSRTIRFRGRDLTTPTVPIVTLAANGAFVLAEDLTFAAGNKVQVIRTIDEDGIQSGGFFRIATRTDSRHGTLADWIGGDNVRGKMRLAAIVYPPISNLLFTPVRVNVRKVGRPFGAYVGRRSKRR